MKNICLVLLTLLFLNCKNDPRQESENEIDIHELMESQSKDSVKLGDQDLKSQEKSLAIEFKQNELMEKKDQRSAFQELIIDNSYVLNKADFTINFKYPLLNESLNTKNKNFNDFINMYYVNVSKTISEIKESKLLCDSIAASKFREDRFIDYKIYIVNDQLVSVLFYKENFYSGAMHPSYSFDGFNFDLNKGVFLTYEDIFVQGTEDELLDIINENIRKGDFYYECWEISSSDFFMAKNNFVLNETYIAFYFDDCVMCPSYTGTYSIELPLVDLLSVLRKSNSNPLVF
ncbi:RsiV family protein [Gelidibacter mesophilus]|uniref:RsiV family protein n=1 Tax=Gelidibacter mesophilus TaxID=169050 RepID=UPI0003F7D0D8|nr:RsiV family protein [Gelidibacter mesophilus]